MSNKVIINRGDSDVRVAFLENEQLVEFHKESLSDKSIVGNIYRGVVQDVIPGLQAAFVDVGLERNVFVHFLDIRPESLVMTEKNLEEALIEASKTVIPGRIVKKGRRDRLDTRAGNVDAPIKKGDTIIVQVSKDGISDKAPRVSANLAIAGRYVVMLPFPGQDGGVSRKIADSKDRVGLKKLLKSLKKETHSFIMRTAGLGADEEHIRRDVERLEEIWSDICTEFQRLKRPGLVYSDHNIVDRLVRDAFTKDIDAVCIDDVGLSNELRSSLKSYMPELVDSIEEYEGVMPIFESYGIDKQLERALDKKYWLKSGGYLIIEETEALTAIDVNTGRFTGNKDQERTSFLTNMEACKAIAEQIRLRDIGGIIAVDFIDMLSRGNQNKVSDEFEKQMEDDRSKSQLGRIGDFGILMLTRKRKYKSLLKQMFESCPYCEGNARVMRNEEIWRQIKGDILLLCEESDPYSAVIITCEPRMAGFLQKESSIFVSQLSELLHLEIIIRADPRLHFEDFTLTGVEKPGRDSFLLPNGRISDMHIIKDSIPYEELSPLDLVDSLQRNSDSLDSAEDEEDTDKERKRTRRGRRGGRKRRDEESDGAEVVAQKSESSSPKPEAPKQAQAPQRNQNQNHRQDNRQDNRQASTPAPRNQAAAPAKPVEKQDYSDLSNLKSGLQIVNANQLTTGQKKPEVKNPFRGLAERSDSADITKLSKVQIIDKPVKPEPKAVKVSDPAEAAAIAAHVPSTAIKIVSQWGSKQAPAPAAAAPAKPAATPKPAAAVTEEKSETKESGGRQRRRRPQRQDNRNRKPEDQKTEAAAKVEEPKVEAESDDSKKSAAKKSTKKSAAKKSAAKKSAGRKKASTSDSGSVKESEADKATDSGAKKATKKAAKKAAKKTAAKKATVKKAAKKATKKAAKKATSKKGDN